MIPTRRAAVGLLPLVLVLGVAVRLPHLGEPPTNHHPTRQYFSALVARDWLATVDPGLVDEPRSITGDARDPLIEPPVMEAVAVGGFLATGGPSWWWPRLAATLLWTAAAAMAFAIGRRLGSDLVGLVAAAVVSLGPATTEAGRSFQPEALLLLASAAALLALLRLREAPEDRRRAVVAGLAVGAAVAVKLTAAPLLLPVAVLAALPVLARAGVRRVALVVALAAAPAGAYYAYGLTWGGFLQGQSGGRFLPELWTTRWLWTEWWHTSAAVVPSWLLTLAAFGAVVAAPEVRRIVLALLAGIALLGLAFPYHVATHTYYSLPVLLPVGLALGGGAAWLSAQLRDASVRRMVAALGVSVFGVCAASQVALARSAPTAAHQPEVVAAREINEALPDGARAAVLTSDYGSALRWYGGLRTTWLPTSSDLRYAELQHEEVPTVPERLDELSSEGDRYLVVTDLVELAHQPELDAALAELEQVAVGTTWAVFDLLSEPSAP